MNFDIDGLDELQDNLKQLAEKGVKEINKGLNRINNGPEASGKSAVPEKCPYCGATLSTNSEEPVIKCEYCGAQFDNSSSKSIVDSVFDFVEKQQQVTLQEREIRLKEMAAKAEKKREKRKKKNRAFFFLLLIMIFAILYIYLVIMGGSVSL
ncbi:MAG: hypothetical protein Q4D29_02575 [Lachnospiraceae bacterium]|nr:hypothetical protein [Lachnospiraceae bacterium]